MFETEYRYRHSHGAGRVEIRQNCTVIPGGQTLARHTILTWLKLGAELGETPYRGQVLTPEDGGSHLGRVVSNPSVEPRVLANGWRLWR